MTDINIESIEEFSANGVPYAVRIFGTWVHPEHGEQQVREMIGEPQVAAYFAAPNQTAKDAIIDGILTGMLARKKDELDVTPVISSTIDETPRTVVIP